MKKLVLIIVSFFLLPFAVQATNSEELIRTQVSSGVIELRVKTTLGFARAIELQVQVSGNAKVNDFVWSSNLKNGYTKQYQYNESTSILKIYIATGNQDNLVSSDGTILLGQVKLEHINNELDYQIGIANNGSFSIVDYDYKKITISNVENNNTDSFMFDKVEVPTNPNQPNKPNNPEKPNNSGNSSDGNGSDDSEKEPDTPTESPDPNQPIVKPNEPQKPSIPKDPTSDQPESEKKDNKISWWLVGGGIVVAALCIGGLIFIYKRLKQVDN